MLRTDSENTDFVELIKQLDQYLKVVDGDDHEFYNQYNSIEALNNIVVCYLDNKPIGCGAFKEFESASVELKRMFVCLLSQIDL